MLSRRGSLDLNNDIPKGETLNAKERADYIYVGRRYIIIMTMKYPRNGNITFEFRILTPQYPQTR